MRNQGIGGYTLIELLTVIAIVGVLVQMSLGGMKDIATKTQKTNTLQTAITALDRARSLAVIHNKRIGVCMMTSTEPSCSSSWNGDYLAVFQDTNQNRQHDVDEEIIYRQQWPSKNIRLEWSNWRREPLVTYEPNGTVVSNGTLTFLDTKNQRIQAIVISKPGRARIE